MPSVSVHTTCPFCRSVVARRDMTLEANGKVAELLSDMSPFQVVTVVSYKSKGFILAGRVKVVYSKGTWSEWYALFDDGTEGWLAEAQGNYMMTFRREDMAVALPQHLSVTEKVDLDGKLYFIEDAREVTYFASEGELPFAFVPKEKAVSVDLRDAQNQFASIAIQKGGKVVYLGEYVPFEEFQFQNLRTLDGW